MRARSKQLLLAALTLSLPPAAMAQVGQPYCPGTACPCGNDDPTAGCANLGSDGFSVTGGRLDVIAGSTYACADDLVLGGSELAANQAAVLFMGGSAQELAFGDGKLCVAAGTSGLYRYPLLTSDGTGSLSVANIVSRSQAFGDAGRIRGGSSWYFQLWYRDPGGPCGSGYDLTNALALTFTPAEGGSGEGTPLAGRPLQDYPWFQYITTFNQGTPVHIAIDPVLHPEVAGATADVYVMAHRDAEQWLADVSLSDVRGAPTVLTFLGSDIRGNTFVVDLGTLNGTVGNRVAVAYDMVVDLDRDGQLGPGDLIDGYPHGPGFAVCRDTQAPGPYPTSEGLYTGGTFLGQKTYWPTNIAAMKKLPLIVVSHGNGHNYQWYDHIGHHMASYGYVVMAHQNNTMPGPEAASTTTLTNTDYLLGNLPTILGGVLDGHVDGHKIIWIGHSRGGEGVVRAYDRLFDGTYVAQYFGLDDVRLISSIAPTDFLGPVNTNPHDVDYHLWTGSADSDVNGGPDCSLCQTFHLLERAVGRRAGIVLQGAGHGAFHDGSGGLFASGPCLLDRPTTHTIMRGYLLPLVRYFVSGDEASKDFLWRQWEEFHPTGAPADNPCVVVNLELKESPKRPDFVVHDWETGGGSLSSSGGTVSWNVTEVIEGRLDDADAVFTWNGTDLMNGMTRAGAADQGTHGIAFTWDVPSFLELEIVPCERDLSDNEWLSFRACQGTRHPNTIAAIEDLRFSLSLRDAAGRTSTISIAAYGGGIEEPYQRTGKGTGAGWANEFETLRVRLTDFLNDSSGLDLSQIVALRFEFGLPGDSPVGRLGLDDIEISLK